MKYRSEIDGLRALAVVPVILFHAGFEFFSGGYIGVDVFFVISGFLITSIILTEKQSGKFRLTNFYERRARRILPALAFVVACCIPPAWIWMMPYELKYFGGSVTAVGLFASNFWFWEYSGYFDGASELKPLLHTWSLAVEEQYYLLFPLLLMLGWRLGLRGLGILIIAITLLSLGLSEWGAHNHPQANFYLLPFRAWELLAGSMTAFYLNRRPYPNGPYNQPLAFLGLVLIGVAIFAFDATTPFPGLYALIPVVGTALFILFAIPGTFAARLMSTRVMVGLGLISYSAYLWHHPLFAFARIRSLSEPTAATYIGLSLLSLVLAYLSWKYIERPFRNPNLVPRQAIFRSAGLITLAMFSIGIVAAATEGFQNRLPVEIRSMLASTDIKDRDSVCKGKPGNFITPENACVYGADVPATILLYGDSHAWRLRHVFGELAAQENLSTKNLAYVGCPPVTGLVRQDQGNDHRCADFNREAHKYLGTDQTISHVVLLGRWTLAIESQKFDNQEGGIEHGKPAIFKRIDHPVAPRSEAERKQLIADSITSSIQSLLETGKTIILIYPVPEVGWDVPNYMARLMFKGTELTTRVSTSHALFRERNQAAYRALDAVGDHPRLIRIKPEEILCDTYLPERCVAQINGQPLYVDSHHLSHRGAALLVKEVLAAIPSARSDNGRVTSIDPLAR